MSKKLHHVAIIMDGNGRWAQLRDKPRTFGHIKGARVAKKIITYASDNSLKNLTLYAFSTENWLRPHEEVSFLMTLLGRYLKKETENLHKKNIRFSVIGELHKLPVNLQLAVQNTVDLTSKNTGLHLTFALSYSSRQEVVLAVQTIAEKLKSGEIQKFQINEDYVSQHLMTAGTPDPDLIIRTSGESRLSNFMMWQSSYSELYFTPVLWPDYTTNDFAQACRIYNQRERRFGKVFQQNEKSFI
ncbi:MAG: isoprenyl transferase [Bdellovibrionaceae bacterium]|nr:isoprenyl transferase [Bdellovibrio sp.]